jgi:hypothetical protein
MSDQARHALLRQRLVEQGVDLSTEAGQTVLRWLERDLKETTLTDWQARLPEAAQLALAVYWDFMKEYNAFYEESDGKGPLYVARALRARVGQVDPHMSEAVLDRIRNRRVHLLDSFRKKYQPSLFAPRAVDAGKVRGYLIRVAGFESLHVPTGDLPWGVGRTIDLAALAEPTLPTPEPESPDPRRLAEAMRSFWDRTHGFTAEQRLEGLTSLGLGFLTGVPEVEERCRDLLRKKLPVWEETTANLRRRASQWLARLEETQRLVATSADAAERERLSERLARIEDRLTRMRARLARQPSRLRPRAAEVQMALDGYVANVGNTRFRRIGREIALFEDRVRTGGRTLTRALGDRLPRDVVQLIGNVEAHLTSTPASPRAHGLRESERTERLRQEEIWRQRAGALLGEIRGHFRLLFGFPLNTDVNEPILNWLADAEDLYEFGLLQRKGVIAGLGRRHGWRLERLLRVT